MSNARGEEHPLISVIIPMRNEELYIERCVASLVAQDYPASRLEILFVDGSSTDATRAIVRDYCSRFSHLRLLENPRRVVPTALNIGLREAKGEIIVRVDGHCVLAPDYVSRCVERLQRTDAANVGGPMRAAGDGWLAAAIALATSSRFGIGNARFHYSNEEEYVDTVYLGAYRREVFDRIGLFDEELVRNQDDEFNYRLRAAGGKILLSPAIRSQYFGRHRLRDLFRQYFQYGLWKVRVAQKHPRSLLPRHLVPGLFVLGVGGFVLAGTFSRWARLVLAAVGGAYLTAATVFAARAVAGRDRRLLPATVAAFLCLHFGYGSGFLAGLARLLRTRGRLWISGR